VIRSRNRQLRSLKQCNNNWRIDRAGPHAS
jgi:hypothetical protein